MILMKISIMNQVYLDFEYDNNGDVIEIGAIYVFGYYIHNYFHCFIKREITNLHRFNVCSQNSHCIHHLTLHLDGITFDLAMSEFENFFENIDGPISIKGHGDDILQDNLENKYSFLKRIDVTYDQVNLLPWKDRQFEKSHIAAFNMKNVTNLIPCHRKNHGLKYNPSWLYQFKTPNHTKIAKLSYGAHCALIDCFEMAFYENSLIHYCCDDHFKDYFITETTRPIEPCFETSYNPLIVHPPLVFK